MKGILIDDTQRAVATASALLDLSRPHDGWSEQQPADWISATEAVLDTLKSRYPDALGALRGIGLSGFIDGPCGSVYCPPPITELIVPLSEVLSKSIGLPFFMDNKTPAALRLTEEIGV